MHQVEGRGHLELALGFTQQIVQPVQRLLAKLGVECTQAALHEHAPRHDVPRAVAADVADGCVALHAFLLESFDHHVQPLHEESLRGKHVAAPAHHPAVSPGTRELDIKGVGPRPEQPRLCDHRAGLDEAGDVQSDHGVGTVVFEQPARDHRLGAFDDLFGGLKDEEVSTTDVPDPVDQGPRDADHDRHVSVVPARMHAAVDARGEVDARLFLNREGVDVGAEHHGLAGPPRVEQCHRTRFGRAALQVQPHLTQSLLEVARRLVLTEADLGMLVEVAPKVDHIVEH